MNKLSDLYSIKSRFHRSVQIEFDRAFNDYILTQIGIKTLRRITFSLDTPMSTKAWSVVGPYGSGKSAFILYLKTLLGLNENPATIHARKLLKSKDRQLYNKLFDTQKRFKDSSKGFCNAFVCAGRERLEYAILKGLYNGVEDFFQKSNSKTPPAILDELAREIERANKGKYSSNDDILSYCRKVVQYVKKMKGEGLLLVVDELGKTLENAVFDTNNDIFILQKIAEMASRSEDFPFLFFTILHQSFERYASRLDSDKRSEWAKVQGRFEDISFVDESEQVFQIIASAIVAPTTKQYKTIISKKTTQTFAGFEDIINQDQTHAPDRLLKALSQCYPLHPLTAMAAVPLFRSKFSQNERSLFAFITSTERFGLVSYIAVTEFNEKVEYPFYCLHHLYDYFVANFGTNLYVHQHSRKWIEIDNALQRIHDPREVQIIKTIGLLDLLSDTLSINVNEATIYCALNVFDKRNKKIVSDTLKNLQRKSVIVFRRYASSYRIWGGSDIDIEQKIDEFKQNHILPTELVSKLNAYFPLRPRVAKRHLFQTGTLRYFKMRFIADIAFEDEIAHPIEEADGQVLFVIPFNKAKLNIKKMKEIFETASSMVKQRTLIGVLPNADRLISSLNELLTLHVVKHKTIELQKDKIARREVDARIADMEHIVAILCEELFYVDNSRVKEKAVWFNCDKETTMLSKKQLSVWLSDVCDKVYSKAPVIKNELVNRNKISVSASSARRLLISAILLNSEKQRLNIKGFPAEYGMYLSILDRSGLHQEEGQGQFKLMQNYKDLEKSWRYLWKFIQEYLDKNSYRKVRLTELYSKLEAPPFGLRAGVLPIIFAIFVKTFENEIAIFDNGTFIPKLKPEDFEIIAKSPKSFEVQLCRIKGVKAEIFDQILDTFYATKPTKEQKRKMTLLHVVKLLCEFVRSLPDYVQTTVHLSKEARAVRRCLLEAKEPATLLYKDLPAAFGIEINNTNNNSLALKYVNKLRAILRELQRKEADLYAQIESILYNAFDIQFHGQDQRTVITERSQMILNMTLDPLFKGFLVRVVDHLEYKSWLDSIGAVVTGRPPLKWKDEDVLKFEHEMASYSVKIKKYEQLALVVGKKTVDSKDQIAQISIMSNKEAERSQIFHVEESNRPFVDELKKQFMDKITTSTSSKEIDIILAALGETAKAYMRENLKIIKKRSNG